MKNQEVSCKSVMVVIMKVMKEGNEDFPRGEVVQETFLSMDLSQKAKMINDLKRSFYLCLRMVIQPFHLQYSELKRRDFTEML